MISFFENLVLAQVNKVVLKPKKQTKNSDGQSEWLKKGYYSYYYGYATTLNTGRRKNVFFQLSKHIRRRVFIGPIEWSVDIPCREQSVVQKGSIIIGQLKSETGAQYNASNFLWWSCNAECFLYFYNLLRYKSKRRVPPNIIYRNLVFKKKKNMFGCETCKNPSPSFATMDCWKGCELCGDFSSEYVHRSKKFVEYQDLWILYMLLVHKNTDLLTRIQTGALRGDVVLSPFNKNYVYISQTPQRFVFMLAWFCGDSDLYKIFVNNLKGQWDKSKTNDLIFSDFLEKDLSFRNLKLLISGYSLSTSDRDPGRTKQRRPVP